MLRARRLALLSCAVLVSWPLVVRAQAVAPLCDACLLGVYDDPQLTRTTGHISSFQIKSVYLGVRLPDGVSVSSLTFDAAYPLGFTVLDATSFITGASWTPYGNGVQITWPQCIAGTRAIYRVRFFTFGTVRDAVLQLQNAVIGACPNPPLQRWRLPTGCYVLNPSGRTVGCATPSSPSTWTAMKGLFK